MKKRFITQSGSEYIIDFKAKTWKRTKGENAATIRSDEGDYNTIDFRFFGDDNTPSIYLDCPPINPPFPRLITSTAIVSEEELPNDG